MFEALTETEVAAVERTWALVAKDLKGHGVQIFLALFTTYPDYQNMFSKMKGIPLDKLATHSALRAHASTFMHGLAAIIDNIGDAADVTSVLEGNVERHVKRGINITHYKNTLNLLPGYLKSQLGDALDNDATSGWTKVIKNTLTLTEKKIVELSGEKEV